MDTLTRKERSQRMALIKSVNTKPEMRVRRLLFSLGYRYRIHKTDLPGKPDIVLRKHKTVIFVNGCFWHRHKNCRYSRTPESNLKYWLPKLAKNKANDRKNHAELRARGWEVIVIWECQTRNLSALLKIIKKNLP